MKRKLYCVYVGSVCVSVSESMKLARQSAKQCGGVVRVEFA